ncbi:hypothetical protein vseg_020143 [Gypsophila vaccaria]
MVEVEDKVGYFQAITGLEDPDLCTDILAAHNWDLELAISAFTSNNNPPHPSASAPHPSASASASAPHPDPPPPPHPHVPSLAWRLVSLPVSVVSGALGLGVWAVGGLLSYSLSMLGLSSPPHTPLLHPSSPSSLEASHFVSSLQRDYGPTMPMFLPVSFMDALHRSTLDYKLLFVYLHSPDHPDTPLFCASTLSHHLFSSFLNHNFVSWAASIRASEGFKMSNTFKASRFPFCALVMAATNQRIALLHQIEGPKTPEEMISILQRVLQETAPVLVSARLEAEERRTNMRLREEQDAAYRAALEADQARERQRTEEQERLERERAEEERKRKEEEEAREREAREAAEREAALVRRRQEKALSLGAEPAKGPDVTQVLVRFPTGERKDRRFQSSATIQSLYDYVDSLECSNIEKYSLVSNFPRTVYGPEKLSLTLKEAGLHPQASLFVEPNL